MKKLLFGGLQLRIGLALVAVLLFFILLTEMTISKLTQMTMIKQAAALSDGAAVLSDTTFGTLSDDLFKLRRMVLFYLVSGGLFVLVMSGFAIHRLVIRPLRQLSAALERVAEGRLDTTIRIRGSGELSEIEGAFNRMTRELFAKQQELALRLEQLSQSNHQLEETQERLVRAAKLASVGTLAAGVAHEIGNPLAGVLGLLEALERGDREHEAEYLNLMKREIQRIDRIIGKLLSFSRMPHSEVPAVSSVSSVLDAIRPLLVAQKVFDGIHLREQRLLEDDKVGISRDDLMQILLNLLLNAAEATTGQGEIVIETERLEDWRTRDGRHIPALAIHVTDSGTGVDASDAAKIFDPFYTKKKKGQGTGLGLSICHNLCDRVGGEIIYNKVYKEGTRFTVTLPRV